MTWRIIVSDEGNEDRWTNVVMVRWSHRGSCCILEAEWRNLESVCTNPKWGRSTFNNLGSIYYSGNLYLALDFINSGKPHSWHWLFTFFYWSDF